MPRPSRGYAARIQPPLPPGDHVERPRLRDLLDAAVPRGVALLVAPGGFGKTVALADFARKASFPVAWLSVSASDGDLASFVEALVAALRRAAPQLGDAAVRAARQPGEAAVAVTADELAGDLAEIDAPLGVVLDDFHAVDSSREPSRFIAALLDRMPAHFFMAIGSRTLPALPHARLLSAGRLAGITAEDLRFTEAEVARYLDATPDSELAQQLFGRTSGWPAALHLAGGSANAAVLDDYLESEVFLQQRPAVREFLLAASVPPTLNEALCRDVLGEPRGGEYLAGAHAQGLFVAALPDGAWRIHDLFREFLRGRLRRTNPERWAALHQRVAEELTAPEAIGLLIEAGLHNDAARMIETNTTGLVESGRWGSIRTWLASLPARVLHGHPRLLTVQARVLAFDAELSEFLRLLDTAVTECIERGDGIGAAEAHAYRAERIGLTGRFDEALGDLARVRQLLEGRDHRVMSIVLRLEGLMAGLRGDLGAADAALAEAVGRAARHRDRAQQAACERGLGRIAVLRNDPGTATAHYERAVHLQEEIGNLRAAAEVRVSLGYVYWELGTPELARRNFVDALSSAERAGYRRVKGFAIENLGVLDREAGQLERAIAGFEASLEIGRALDDAQLVAASLNDLALCRRAMGMATAAEVLAQQALAEATRANMGEVAIDARTSVAGALLDQGMVAEALAAARLALMSIDGERASYRRVRALLIAAVAARAVDDPAWGEYLHAAAANARQLKNRGFLRAEVALVAGELDALAQVAEVADAAREILSLGRSDAVSASPVVATPTSPRLPTLRLRLLGKPDVLIDGAPPSGAGGHWRLAPTRELLFLLEANRTGLAPEQIVDRLWPDAAPGRGQQLFWHYAHRLRGVLGANSLVKDGQHWQLNADLEIDSDVAEYQIAVSRVRDATPGTAEEAAALAEAHRLYTGPYLDGVWADWAERRRDALESVHREVLLRQVERHLAAGEASAGVHLAQRLLRAQPLSEEACRLLLRALIAAGQRVNARQVYHRFARRVEDRIGAPPASSIRAFLAGA